MSGVNKCILLGNVGKDPDVKRLDNGVLMAHFSLATSENFKDKNSGEKKEHTEWHNIVMWRNIAESVEKSDLKKGDRVYLEGKIKSRKWTDKSGVEKFGVEIVADTFTIVSRKKTDGATADEVEVQSSTNDTP